MWDRWRQILLLAAGLSAIAVIARLVSRFAAEDNPGRQDVIAWVAFGAIAVTLGVVAFLWARRYPMGRVVLDLGGAALIGCLFAVLVGPFISGGSPFASGAGNFFGMIWLYAGIAIGGSLLGLLVVTALGWDYRSQALKRFSQAERERMRRRPVRR